MKCFKIEEGGERFWYAAETQEAAMAEHRDLFADEGSEIEIREATDEEMDRTIIIMEDEYEWPGGSATLREVFDTECSAHFGGALQLASSVY